MSAFPMATHGLYSRLCALPEHQTGEILQGVLYTQPRPAGPHALAATGLMIEIGARFHRGDGGPGPWWIIVEPEVHISRDVEVAVPDIAGWRRERLPRIPRGHQFEVVPDWVYEILSPGTAQKDRVVKMPLYAQHGLAHLWLADPLARTLEAFALQDGRWLVIGLFKENDIGKAAPFEELAINLADLWAETEDT